MSSLASDSAVEDELQRKKKLLEHEQVWHAEEEGMNEGRSIQELHNREIFMPLCAILYLEYIVGSRV